MTEQRLDFQIKWRLSWKLWNNKTARDMTAQQIVNDLILDNQNLVIEELMKHDESLWDELENFDEDTDVLEWWLVTPFMADMLKNNGEVILAAYDCYWWGRQTSGQGLSMDWVIQEIARQTER